MILFVGSDVAIFEVQRKDADVVRSDVFCEEDVGVPMGGFPILDPFIRSLNHPIYVFLREKIYLKISDFVRKNPEFIKKIRRNPEKSGCVRINPK